MRTYDTIIKDLEELFLCTDASEREQLASKITKKVSCIKKRTDNIDYVTKIQEIIDHFENNTQQSVYYCKDDCNYLGITKVEIDDEGDLIFS